MERRSPKQNGVALVLVLWVMALLMVIAAGFSSTMRTETNQVANLVSKARLRAAVDGAIHIAAMDGMRPEANALFPRDGTPVTLEVLSFPVTVRIQDARGRVDLNRGERALIEGLLTEAGANEERRTQILDAIEDWKDTDDLTRMHGAEDADYEAAGYPYGAKDAPFDSVEELQQVMGVDRALYQALEPHLTVHSGSAAIQPEYASVETLAALPGFDDSQIEQIRAERSAAVEQGVLPVPSRVIRSAGGTRQRLVVRAHAEQPGTAAVTVEVTLQPQMTEPGYSRLLSADAPAFAVLSRTEGSGKTAQETTDEER